MTYGKFHRFFLRTVASQGAVSMSDAQEIVQKFNDEEETSVQDVVKSINDEIRQFQQEIKITSDEVTNEKVIVFLSLGYDEATKAQNIFSANELEYFRVLLEQIMTTESRQITGMNAINLASSMKSTFTKSDAQRMLNIWHRMKYLDKDQNNYALGVRAVHEFEGYIRTNMPDAVEQCCLCKQTVFRGYNCPACALAIHNRCLMGYLEKIQKWPCCKVDFDQSQLDRLTSAGSRLLSQSQANTTQDTEEQSIEVQPTQTQQSESMELDITQEVIPEISQRVTRKRKRLN
ncbi:unnamed protein product [Spodoptera littoralis]|uniref:Non-structural maintenance of chromosomes element 1 homolog n=1 Tax=Spodoptera littoralis TaxID=7109 RepID=A0A9P0MZD3_SPOLI|nr:unnamed protein product [Spodoptera littoralis]CAH1635719.1 unnamed protein product [Spodoptera littoralis]